MKKKLLILITSIVLILTGCGVKHVDGELEDIMDRLYNGISEEELPMMLQNTELTEENIENYIGTKDIKWSEAIVSESIWTERMLDRIPSRSWFVSAVWVIAIALHSSSFA